MCTIESASGTSANFEDAIHRSSSVQGLSLPSPPGFGRNQTGRDVAKDPLRGMEEITTCGTLYSRWRIRKASRKESKECSWMFVSTLK